MMKPILLFYVLVFTLFNTYGLGSKQDSLQSLIDQTTVDTTKTRLMIELSEAIDNNDFEKALSSASSAFALAKKSNNDFLIAKSQFQLAYIQMKMYKLDDALINGKQSLAIFQKLNNMKFVVKCEKLIGITLMDNQKYSEALEYLNNAALHAKKANDFDGLASAYHNQAYLYDLINNPDKATHFYNLALQIDSSQNNLDGIARTLLSLGALYGKSGQNDKAFYYYNESYKLFLKLDLKRDMAYLLSNIGNMYNASKEYRKAIEYYDRSIQLKNEIGDKNGIATSLTNKGVAYRGMNILDSALICMFEGLQTYQQLGRKSSIAITLSNISSLYRLKGDFEKAALNINDAIKINEEINDKNGIAKCYWILGNINRNLKENKKALQNFNLSEKNALEAKGFITLRDVYISKSELFEDLAKPTEALSYYKKFHALYDSLLNETKSKQLVEVKIKYETELKDSEINQLNKLNLSKEEALRKQQIIIVLIVSLAILLLVLAIFYYKSNKTKARINQQLLDQKHEILAQNHEITIQRNLLTSKNQELQEQKQYIANQRDVIESELKESLLKSEILKRENIQFQLDALKNQLNPHFLFNTFSTLISLIPENPTLAETYTRHLSSVYRYILSSKERELVSISEEIEFINSYMFLVTIRFDNNVTLRINVADGIKQQQIPLLSLQLLIENAVKHNIISAKKPLDILINSHANKLIVTNTLQVKSSAEISTGIGLKNIINRYRLLTSEEVEIIKTSEEFIVKIPIINIA